METDLENGIQMTLEKTLPLAVTPRLVAVYGYPNAGKSFFLHELCSQLYTLGHTTYCGGYPDNPDTYLSFILQRDFLIFQLGYDISQNASPAVVEAGLDTFRYLSRGMDFNVAIYNPSLHSPPRAQIFTHPQTGATFHYDLIICNPDSKEK